MIILFTSALINDFYEQRKKEYEKSINSLFSMGYKENIEILECVYKEKEKTFLDNFTNNVFYSRKNYTFSNKGVNEILNIKNFLQNKKNSSEEKILKLTGRYILQNDFFIKKCELNEYDVILKRDSHNQVFFGCVCARKKVFDNFIESIDWQFVENNSICIEKIFSDFLKEKNYTTLEFPKINIKFNINNNDLNFF